jgi:ABC-2 type transport system ATP-binding protein
VGQHIDVTGLLQAVHEAGVRFTDIHTTQSSLEDIFVNLLEGQA